MMISSSDYFRIMFGSWSDYARIIFILVILLAPRIVNDVSYIRRINHEIHFALQAQYLVKLEWLLLFRTLQMMLHIKGGSIIRFIIRGKRNIW